MRLGKKLKFVLGRVENTVGKGENAGLPAFSPFPAMFSKGLLRNLFTREFIASPSFGAFSALIIIL